MSRNRQDRIHLGIALLVAVIVLATAVIAPSMDAADYQLEQHAADAVTDLAQEQAAPALILSHPIAPLDRHGAAYLATTGDHP
jgi:hypothetical protein